MGLTVADASVSIAVVDADDALYDVAASAVEDADDEVVLPASAYAETLVRPHRLGQAAAVQAKLADLGFRVEPLTGAMADEAARLRAHHRSLRLGDALVIATAIVLHADVLLTGDRRLAGVWDRVRVLEP